MENPYAWILRNRRTPPNTTKTKNTHSKREYYASNKILSTVDINMKSIKDWAIIYLGATSHFLVTTSPIKNITPESSPLNVKLPDGSCVSSTLTCTLNLTQLPTRAREGLVYMCELMIHMHHLVS